MSALLLGLLLAGGTVFLILQPLLTGESAPMGRDEEELTDAQHRKRIALLGLRDVEYDFHAGKLDEEDYWSLKNKLSAEALEAMDLELSEEMERGERGLARAQMEAEIAALRSSLREGSVCGHCGDLNPRIARFCGACGSALPLRDLPVTASGSPPPSESGR
jgi:ribosomal protein L40E